MRTITQSLPFATVAAFLAQTAAAQIPTTPWLNANQEGTTYTAAMASDIYRRTQFIYEHQLVRFASQSVKELYLRPDSNPRQINFPSFTRNLTIRMSATGVPSPELADQTSFSANYGSDVTTVLDNKPVSFPAFVQGGTAPASFSVRIPLDKPFDLDYQGHLLIEIESPATGTGPGTLNWYADAEFYQGQPWTVLADTFGTGCGPQQGFSATTYGQGLNTTIETVLSFVRQPGGSGVHPSVAWLGTSTTSWGPLPLPFPLALAGAPGCFINVEPALSMIGMTSGGSGERFYLRLPVPRDFSLLGKTIFTQSAVFDSAAGNALGLRLSPGAGFYFSSPPSPYQTMMLTRIGDPGDEPEGAQPNVAMIIGMQ